MKVFYGKGHLESEKLVELTLGKGAVVEFSVKNVQDQLLELTKELKSKKIKQVLFVIATHGDDPINNKTDQTHRIQLTDSKFKKKEHEFRFKSVHNPNEYRGNTKSCE